MQKWDTQSCVGEASSQKGQILKALLVFRSSVESKSKFIQGRNKTGVMSVKVCPWVGR